MGVDPSREAIARARRLTRVANRAFSEGVDQALDAPDGSYDIVVSSLRFRAALAAARRRRRPPGESGETPSIQ